MVTKEEAETMGKRLEALQCVDPAQGDGLFLYVFMGEPTDQAIRYESHFRDCEYCRIALEIYRYKRGIARQLGSDTVP